MTAVTLDKTTKLPKLTKGKVTTIPHTAIKRDFNIRSAKNVQKVDDILDSIRVNGVKEAIKINLNGINVDGARRLFCLDLIAEEKQLPSIDVEVLPLDIADEEIPHYQYLTFARTGISTREKNAAIYEYVLRNPNENNADIARKFTVSKGVLNSVSRIIRATDELTSLVIEDEIAQNAALCIINSVLKQKPIDEIDDQDKVAIKALTDILKPEIEKEKKELEAKNETFKSWNIRDVNGCLAKYGLEPLASTKADVEEKPKHQKLSTLQEEFFSQLQFVPTDDGTKYQINAIIPKDLVDTIMQLIVLNSKGSIKELPYSSSLASESGHWGVWEQQQRSSNGLTFVQINGNKFSTYETDVDYLTENNYTSNLPIREEGGISLYFTKSEFTQICKELTDKGVNVTKLVKVKDSGIAAPTEKKKKGRPPKAQGTSSETNLATDSQETQIEFDSDEEVIETPDLPAGLPDVPVEIEEINPEATEMPQLTTTTGSIESNSAFTLIPLTDGDNSALMEKYEVHLDDGDDEQLPL